MPQKKFKRKIENFLCSRCGTSVKGTGYTDHCSKCLWSKHVDINPGDRKAKCNGMMEPVGVETKNSEYIIYYKCAICGYKHRVKSSSNDNFDEIIKTYARTRRLNLLYL
ncbi:RNHCP domain-containing protein [Candidatus Parcubacteria bacterium]|nr:RNHCP domain-containing protein [Patescibacteria group bacterium]MBU4482355.1 RNHCP domain-containing protein [Patescibacteria group bacterium]MCG2686514.1 RNHCP domain-containing protein [Candidatus Parcubacteria bacterium]